MGVDVACGDDSGLALAIDELLEIGTISAVLESTAWLDIELDVCAIDEVTVCFDGNDRDDNGDEVLYLKERRASIRCRRLTLLDGVGFPLILSKV